MALTDTEVLEWVNPSENEAQPFRRTSPEPPLQAAQADGYKLTQTKPRTPRLCQPATWNILQSWYNHRLFMFVMEDYLEAFDRSELSKPRGKGGLWKEGAEAWENGAPRKKFASEILVHPPSHLLIHPADIFEELPELHALKTWGIYIKSSPIEDLDQCVKGFVM